MPNRQARSYKYRYDDQDPYVYPGTHVLVNKFDLHDFDDLSMAEC